MIGGTAMPDERRICPPHLQVVPDAPVEAPPWASLVRSLAAIQEHEPRLRRLEELALAEPPRFAGLFAHLLLRVRRPLCRGLYLDCVRLLFNTERVGYPQRERLYRAARIAEVSLLRLALLSLPGRAPEPEAEAPDPELGDLPLGTRKTLARTARPELLARLSHDPEPVVVRRLLGHPRLTRAHVLAIASRRPGRAEVLTGLILDPRWGGLQDVQEAVVRNPWTPASLSCALLPLVAARARKDLRSGSLCDPVVGRVAAWLEGDAEALATLL